MQPVRCVRHVCDVRHRPSIIEVPAAAIARCGFGFTSVSRGVRTARHGGGWCGGIGVARAGRHRDTKIKFVSSWQGENPLIARSQELERVGGVYYIPRYEGFI